MNKEYRRRYCLVKKLERTRKLVLAVYSDHADLMHELFRDNYKETHQELYRRVTDLEGQLNIIEQNIITTTRDVRAEFGFKKRDPEEKCIDEDYNYMCNERPSGVSGPDV